MKRQRKRITKLFDENPKISNCYVDFTLNTMSVSCACNDPFTDILDIVKVLNRILKEGKKNVFYYELFEEEGPETRISFTICPWIYDEQIINIDIHQYLHTKDDKEIDFFYQMTRQDLCNNVFHLIENNLDTYNGIAEENGYYLGEELCYDYLYPLDPEEVIEAKKEIFNS